MIYLVDFENVHSAGLEGIERLTEKDKIYIFYSDQANQITVSLHERLMESAAEYRFIEVHTGRNALDFQLSSYLGYLIGTTPKTQYVILSNDTGFNPLVQFWNENHVCVFKKSTILSSLPGKVHQPNKRLPAPAETTLEIPSSDLPTAEAVSPEALPAAPVQQPVETPSEMTMEVSPEEIKLEEAPETEPLKATSFEETAPEVPAKNANASNAALAKELAAALPEFQDKLPQITKIIHHYKTKTGINNALVKAYKSETAGVIYKKIKPLLSGKK